MNLGGQTAGNKQSAMPSSSGTSHNSAGADQFPAGLRVLVVDDDPTCLMILEKMLRNCKYEVTKCNRAEVALSLLRENKNGFDVVISDVHMPDMDGFKLLEHIGLEMDLPVIMMSADDSKSVVMKGVTHGACDYLIKPVRIEALRNIWQHVVRKRKHEWRDLEPSATPHHQQPPPEDPDSSSSANEGNNNKRQKDDNDEGDERDDSSSLKKPRVVWSVELHQQFVAAVNQLGIDKAVPKKILDLMNVPGLTRENVASHLQKYRLYLRRLSGSQHPGASFMGHSDTGYGSISSLNELDLQALAASGQLGQLPAQSLATLQAAVLGRSNHSKTPVSMPLIDQRNIFSFENPKYRYGQGVSQHLNTNNNNKHVNLLHGIPTNMEPKQLASLHQSGPHSFGGIGMGSHVLIPMTGQSQSQSLSSGSHLQSVMPTRGGTAAAYNSTISQPSSLDFSVTHKVELTGNGFPPRGNSGTSSGLARETDVSRGGIVPSYDIFNYLNQNRLNWGIENVGLTFDSYASGQKVQGLQNQSSTGSNVIFSPGEGSGTHVAEIPLRVKAESLNHGRLYPEHYDPDDLLTAILKQQQQEVIAQLEKEFGPDR